MKLEMYEELVKLTSEEVSSFDAETEYGTTK